MKPAKSADWKTKPMPEKRALLSFDRYFNHQEMKIIKLGLIPEQMEDKWFVYYQKCSLFFHRSWTGFCIYVVHFEENRGGFQATRFEVNRDPSQYKGVDDLRDCEMVSCLFDILLLRRPASFPSSSDKKESALLQEWCSVGRAMLGEHPKSSPRKEHK